MNRKIKFRVWIPDKKIMTDAKGLYFDNNGLNEVRGRQKLNRVLYRPFQEAYHFECVLMQYTGLNDKNGVEIYEGDIVQTGWQGNEKGVVVFEGSTYCVDSGNGYMYFNHPESYEVIGDIYKNPELLKE